MFSRKDAKSQRKVNSFLKQDLRFPLRLMRLSVALFLAIARDALGFLLEFYHRDLTLTHVLLNRPEARLAVRQAQENDPRIVHVSVEALEIVPLVRELLLLLPVLDELDLPGDAEHGPKILGAVAQFDVRVRGQLPIHALHRAGGEIKLPVIEKNRQESPDPRLVPVNRGDEARGVLLYKRQYILVRHALPPASFDGRMIQKDRRKG